MTEYDIIHQFSYAYTPQQNDVAEHKNFHLLETARTLLILREVVKYLWSDVVIKTCLINQIPSSFCKIKSRIWFYVFRTICLLWHRKFLVYVFFQSDDSRKTKLDYRTLKCNFLRYSRT